MTAAIIIILAALLVVQQLFWAIQTHRLMNKLMSRNYHEYKQTEQAFEAKPKAIVAQEEDLEDLGVLEGFGIGV